MHAQHIADKIETLLWGYRRILQVLPSFSYDMIDDVEHLKKDIQTYSRHMEEDYVEEISLYDNSGMILYSTGGNRIGLSEDQKPFFLWAQKEENRGRLFISQPLTDRENPRPKAYAEPGGTKDTSPGFMVLLAVPIYRRALSESSLHEDLKFTGVLTFLIDLKEFLARELKDYRMRTHNLWVVDKDGKLLFNSEHPEMVLRNFRQRDETCVQCHLSFDYAEKILEKGEGTIDYRVKSAPMKLAAFARVKFGEINWVVVVNSSYDTVAAFTRKSLVRSLLLLGTVVLFFLLGSSYLIHNERMKVRAEEESRHWQESIAERKLAEEVLRRSAEQLHHLSFRLLTIQEEERRRISKELHDEFGGALATLKLRENLIKGRLREDQGDLIKECEKITGYIDQIMEEVHRMLRNLTPSVLEHLGLPATLQWLANDHSKRNNCKVTLDIPGVIPVLSMEAQITIFRIFQEAFRNIEKYGHTANVSVAIGETTDDILFSIKDDGKGFDLTRVASQNVTEKGLGLTIMDERARMLGGHFEIESEEGKGTRIAFQVPKVEKKG